MIKIEQGLNFINTVYECEACAQIFLTEDEFINHHVNNFKEPKTCCNCNVPFKKSSDLREHYNTHIVREDVINFIDPESDLKSNYKDMEAVLKFPKETSQTIASTSELIYILDDSQCANEVIIEEEVDLNKSKVSRNNASSVHIEHGYVAKQIPSKKIQTKKHYTEQQELPPRRHEMPQFSSTEYEVLNPNKDVNMPHCKCVRCEQLFINKYVFYKHIEKGKCFVNSCDVCAGRFEKNSDFYEHYITEHTDRAICNFCFKTFMYEKNVREHMLRHLDQFRHLCEVCHKGFYTIREYRNHYKNRHMGIKHKCSVCSRSFADEYYFKRHVASHKSINNDINE